jgi:site-specific DNA-methyltransferase (adenine-specific)
MIVQADALDFLRSVNDDSVQLVATDPPYFRVVGEAWDRQWDHADAFLDWVGLLADEWQRVLAPNGTLYVFASPQMAARVQRVVAERFAVLNECVWVKSGGWAAHSDKEALRCYFPQTERIVVAEQFGADGSALMGSGYAAEVADLRAGVFEPLRAYLVAERDRAGITNRQVDEHLGTNGMAGHYFGASQWALPTEDVYEKLRELFNRDGLKYEHLRREYEDLRREYEDLRREYEDLRREYEDLRREYEDLRRPFFASADSAYTDVWTFPTVPAAKSGQLRHPCEKPLDLMRHIVEASSRPGDLVVDCFVGSGSTAVAAKSLGRDFAGCDASADWVDYATRRVEAWTPGRDQFRPLRPAQDLSLFDEDGAA